METKVLTDSNLNKAIVPILTLILLIVGIFTTIIYNNPLGVISNGEYSERARQERGFFAEYVLNRISSGESFPYYSDGSLVMMDGNYALPRMFGMESEGLLKSGIPSVDIVDSIDTDLVELLSDVIMLRNESGLTKSGTEMYESVVGFYADRALVTGAILVVILLSLFARNSIYPLVIVALMIMSATIVERRGDNTRAIPKIDPLISTHIAEYISNRCENKYCGQVVYKDNCLFVVNGKICDLTTKQRASFETFRSRQDFNIPQVLLKK